MDQEELDRIVDRLKNPIRQAAQPLAHKVANLCYWASLLLLLIGMRMVIDPYNRRAGELSHIYITLGSFEVYMWLLVALGRWHILKRLPMDSVRSVCFTVGLGGFFFMALNEMYLTATQGAYAITALALLSALVKLRLLMRFIGLKTSAIPWLFVLGWLLFMALPAPLLQNMTEETRYRFSLTLCWLIAFWLAAHFHLVKKQYDRGFFITPGDLFRSWYTAWALLALLALGGIGQACSVTYVFADWAYWYFSPIFLTIAGLAICLSHRFPTARFFGWLMLAGAIFYMFTSATEKLPAAYPVQTIVQTLDTQDPNSLWTQITGAGSHFWLHPLYPSVLWISLVFALAAVTISTWWLLIFAVIGPLAAVIFKTVKIVSTSRNGKGFGIIILAFALLGGGVLIQWAQEKWGQKHSKIPIPDPSNNQPDDQPTTPAPPTA